MEFKIWEVWYISCEGNNRRFEKECPVDWDEDMVRADIPCHGCGDDPAEIISIEEIY